MGIWLSVVWLIVVFALMLGLRRWVEVHIQGLAYLITGHPTVSMWIFFLIFLPGILVHELSHWLAATLLQVPTGQIVIWPKPQGKRAVLLGTVQVGRVDPVRNSLIGLAPLVSGSLLITLIGAHLQLDTLGNTLSAGHWQLAWDSVARSISLPDFWLWLYLLFAVANRMMPSPADREAWTQVAIFLVCLSAIVMAAGWTPHLDPEAQDVMKDIAGFLLYAFSLTVAIDLLMALVVGTMEMVVTIIRRQRVSY